MSEKRREGTFLCVLKSNSSVCLSLKLWNRTYSIVIKVGETGVSQMTLTLRDSGDHKV